MSWIVPPSRAVWIAPDVEHEMTMGQSVDLRPVRVLADRNPIAGISCRIIEVSNLLRELMIALEKISFKGESARSRLLGELIIDELAEANELNFRIPLPNEKRLRSLCMRLINDPSLPHTLAEWSRLVGASERTLARLFESELDTTFGQWRQQVRLAHATGMIA